MKLTVTCLLPQPLGGTVNLHVGHVFSLNNKLSILSHAGGLFLIKPVAL